MAQIDTHQEEANNNPELILPSKQNIQPILSLARQGKIDYIEKLLSQSENNLIHLDDIEEGTGYSVLHWIILCESSIHLLHKILNYSSAYIELKTISEQQTPVMWACSSGHLVNLKILIKYSEISGINLKHLLFEDFDSLGANALLIAIQNYQDHIVLWLIITFNLSIDDFLNYRDGAGTSYLHWICFKNNDKLLKLLEIHFNLDLSYLLNNYLDSDNMNLLHRSVLNNSVEIIKYLIDFGHVDENCLNLQNADEETPLDIAIRLKYPLIVNIINRRNIRQNKSSSSSSLFSWALPLIYVFCATFYVFYWLIYFERKMPAYSIPLNLVRILTPITVYLYYNIVFGNPGIVGRNNGIEKTVSALNNHAEECIDHMEIRYPTISHNSYLLEVDRICYTCNINKDYRTKHCGQCGVCVYSMDHHCTWVNNCIGKDNHRQFILFCLLEMICQILFIYIYIYLYYEEINATFIFITYPGLSLFTIWLLITTPWLCVLNAFNIRLVVFNLKTNEFLNFKKYKHFWKRNVDDVEGGALFINRFNKGAYLNCLYFWKKDPKYDYIGEGDSGSVEPCSCHS